MAEDTITADFESRHGLDPRTLAREGILDLGAYVPGRPVEEVRDAYGLDEVVKLASNECLMPLPERLRHVIDREFDTLCRYPDGHCRRLGARVAERVGVARESLLFGNGAEECVRLIGQAFLNPGDTGVIPSPVYDAYDTAVRMPGASVVQVPLRDYHIDLDATVSAVDERTKIIWLCSPANPTGTIIRRDEFARFLARLPERVSRGAG